MDLDLVNRAQRLLRTETRVWGATAGVVWLAYLATAHWNTAQVNDTLAAVLPAWQWVHAGTFDLSTLPDWDHNSWLTHDGERVVSNRMMGVVLAGVPFAALFWWLEPAHVNALAGATYTALAVANVHVLVRTVVPARLALLSTVVLALGSPLWTTAGAELWPHGPDAFWISVSLLAVQRQWYGLAGLALVPAITTRPYLAVSAAVLGLWLAAAHRRAGIAVRLGAPAMLAVPLLLLWNGWYYGQTTLGGGYGGRAQAVLAPPAGDVAAVFLRDLAGALASPETGLFVHAPVALVLLLGLPAAWRSAPSWCHAAAAAGVVYQLLQLRGNRYSGGGGFYSNRLVVELLVFSAPLLALAAHALLRRRTLVAQVLSGAAGASVGLHLFGAMTTYWLDGAEREWWEWQPLVVVQDWGWGSLPLVLAACAIPVLAVLLHRRATAQQPVIPAQRASAAAEPLVRS